MENKINYLDTVSQDMKEAIAEEFNYTWNFDFLDLVALVISRLEVEEKKDKLINDETIYFGIGEILDEIENSLIYNYQQWEVMKFYQSPDEANLYKAFDQMAYDILGAITLYIEKVKQHENN